MTREIKFRAWDKSNKKWWNNWSNGYLLSLEGKFLQTHENDCGTYEISESKEASDRFVLCQFTGLLDKNGKEIYEGDIVGYWGKDVVWEVLFIDGSFRYGNHVTNFPAKELKRKEVIGNIYESKHLLEK